MMFNLGKNANKSQGKAKSSSMKGKVPTGPGVKLRPQNDGPSTHAKTVSGDKQADAGVKVEEKRQKKVIRKNALYSDQAIALAKGRK